ncbi:hypothetical protein BC941DRAFT_506383 [Chlamydoabsidia padenii]|nr:hypothetical protein BC941DRAFT_506383 [Chlamydoabsidia padenii]
MTHLSDFSYLQRDAQEIYLTCFLLIRMWQADGFKCLSPRRVINGELRSIVTWFMFLLMVAQASWDFLCTYIKYTEGFMQVAPKVIIGKPFQYWSLKNQDPIEIMNYIQCVTFSLQVSILLLLQCFWNYLSNVVARHSFMGSKEFIFYIAWTIVNIALFPILQYFYKHTSLEEVVPQTAYSCEILIVAVIGFKNHMRFNRLIKVAKSNGNNTDGQVNERLTYFRDMNLLLSVALVAFGGSIFILCIDGFTTNKVINSNKFAADLLICNTNVSSIFLWLIIIGIFHPARVALDGKKKKNKRADRFTTPHDNTSAITLTSPIQSPPPRYNTDKKVLSTTSGTEMDYLSSSPPVSVSTSTSGVYHEQQRGNVVSINDPYVNEPISFSLIQPGKYYYGNTNSLSSFTPPPLSPPSFVSPQQQLYSPSLGLRSTAVSPPPTQELPPIPTASQWHDDNRSTNHVPWLERSTSPGNR